MDHMFLMCFFLCPDMVNWQQYFFRTTICNLLRLSNRDTSFSKCSSVPLINKFLLLIYMRPHPKPPETLTSIHLQQKGKTLTWPLANMDLFMGVTLLHCLHACTLSTTLSAMNFSLFLKNQNGMHNLFSTRYQSNTSAYQRDIFVSDY